MKPGAHRGRRLPARQRWCSDGVALSLTFSPVAKNKHRLNVILRSRTTLKNSYIFYPKSQMEARQSPFMLPSCLEAHGTPSHENGDRAPYNPPSTRQPPLTPATAPGSPAVLCSECTHAHETKEEKRKKGLKVPRQMKKTKNRSKGTASNKRSGSSEKPETYQPSTLRE